MMARDLMSFHRLGNWSFQFDGAELRFGFCSYSSKTISLSEPLTISGDEENVIDTILHEIAHALTPMINHGIAWQMKAIEIGANGKRCSKSLPPTVQFKHAYTCPSCGHTYKTMKRLRNARSRYHPACRNKGLKACLIHKDLRA